MDEAKKSLSENIYFHKIVRCFYSDDLYKLISTNITDSVFEKIKEEHNVLTLKEIKLKKGKSSILVS
jgi:hypothetical protein